MKQRAADVEVCYWCRRPHGLETLCPEREVGLMLNESDEPKAASHAPQPAGPGGA